MAVEMTYGEALSVYAANAGTKAASYARRYIEECDGDADPKSDQVFTRYIGALVDRGLKRGTANLHRRMIAAFFRATNEVRLERGLVGLHVPQARGWQYDSERESRRTVIDAPLIARMIDAAKRGDLSPRQTSILCLSTIWGVRAIEISRVRAEDVDRAGERIFIQTAKKGQPRWCWLPPEAAPWLQETWTPTRANTITKAFAGIWGSVLEVERPDRTAWHAIRRAITEAMDGAGVSEQDRARFMRWKTRGSSMAQLYANPTVRATETGEAPARAADDEGTRAFDRAAWDAHPFLRLWG